MTHMPPNPEVNPTLEMNPILELNPSLVLNPSREMNPSLEVNLRLELNRKVDEFFNQMTWRFPITTLNLWTPKQTSWVPNCMVFVVIACV